MNAAKAAFADYLENANLNDRQIYFVNQIVEYIVRNGIMKDVLVLQDSPFTDRTVRRFPGCMERNHGHDSGYQPKCGYLVVEQSRGMSFLVQVKHKRMTR